MAELAKSRDPITIKAKIEVDTSELDEALEKAAHLNAIMAQEQETPRLWKIKEVYVTYSTSEANDLLYSGKWVLLEIFNVSNYIFGGNGCMPNHDVVEYILGRRI